MFQINRDKDAVQGQKHEDQSGFSYKILKENSAMRKMMLAYATWITVVKFCMY